MTKKGIKWQALILSVFGILLVGQGILISENDNFGFEVIAMGSITIAFGALNWVKYFKEQP